MVVSVRVGVGVVEGPKDGVILEIDWLDIVLIVEVVVELWVCMMIRWLMIASCHVVVILEGAVWSRMASSIFMFVPHIMMRHHTKHIVVMRFHWGHVMITIRGWVLMFTFIEVFIDNILFSLG